MARIKKEPEERRNELIEIAEALFIEKGYDYATIEEIIKRAEIAKGTFYYYFKSKSDILDAVLDQYVEEIDEFMKDIAVKKGMGAVEKMLKVFTFFREYSNDKSTFINYIHQERNAHIHIKVEKKFVPVFVYPFAKIVREGVQQGLFNTKYPTEAALAILVSSIQFGNTHGSYVDLRDKKRKGEAALDIMERILGAEPGLFLSSYREVKK